MSATKLLIAVVAWNIEHDVVGKEVAALVIIRILAVVPCVNCSVDLLFLFGCVCQCEFMLCAALTETTVGVHHRDIIEEEVVIAKPVITNYIIVDFGRLESLLVVLDSDVEDAVFRLFEAKFFLDII